MVKDEAEEDVWKRRDFGNNPPLMGHTKPNRFSKKSLGSYFRWRTRTS
jgi:hypothetical protein